LQAALRRGDVARPALEDGQRRISCAQLDALVTAEGQWLADSQGERFAVLADNGAGWAITDLALHTRHLISVPLPGYFSEQQLLHAMDDAGIDSLLAADSHRALEMLDGWKKGGISERTGLTLFRRALDPAARPSLPVGTAKITYTSGSTDKPRGVCLSADQLEAVAASLAAATAALPVTRHLCLLPLATLLENIAGIYAPLLAGACSVLPSARVTGMSYAGPDVPRMLQAVATGQPESLVLVPELLQMLVIAAERGWPIPASIRFVAVGGASVGTELLRRAQAVGLPVFEGYGLSECASVVCLNVPEARRFGSVGRPMRHAKLRVDEDGELMVSGVTMLGYLGDEPRHPSAELSTGDVGEVDEDGYVYVRGRRRNVFITSYGRNVEPEWVEREILQQAGIRHALVHGEARPYAVALVSPMGADDSESVVNAAIAAANARLPDYARVSRWAWAPDGFSYENGLLTANGRLRRPAVLARHGALIDSLYREESA
jgi:long-subunit acyl-CoA synthetase (AMP-forming)